MSTTTMRVAFEQAQKRRQTNGGEKASGYRGRWIGLRRLGKSGRGNVELVIGSRTFRGRDTAEALRSAFPETDLAQVEAAAPIVAALIASQKLGQHNERKSGHGIADRSR